MVWQTIFPFIFIFSLVDGFISRLLYPAKLPLLYRDIFILVVYFLFASQEHVGRWINKLQKKIGNAAWLLAMSFLFIGMLQIFNPSSPGLLLGLLGFKLYFLYWPLAILAFAYVDDMEKVKRVIQAVVYASAPINLFGLYQFSQGPEYMIATFGEGYKGNVMVAHIQDPTYHDESFLRILGTFGSSGQFSNFLVVNVMFCFALLFMASTPRQRWLLYGCQALNFLALLGTGSRGALVTIILQLFVFSILCRRARPVAGAAVIASFFLYLGFSWLGRDVVKRYESLRQIEELRKRALDATGLMFLEAFEKYPLGEGLGSASGAARHLKGQEGTTWQLVENYPSKVQLETGIIGVILFYLFLVMLMIRWFKRWIYWYRFLDSKTFDLSIALTAYCFAQFAFVSIFGSLDSPPASVFLWAVLGMSARISSWGEEREMEGWHQDQEPEVSRVS